MSALAIRRQRQAAHLHGLGPRATYEAMLQLVAGADLDKTLAAYSRLNAETLEALGGDRFAPALFVVSS